jgi:hypothetical protein
MDAVLDQMPPHLQKLALLLAHHSKADAARQLGIPRMTLYTSIAAIRRRFEKAGLQRYL